MPSRIRNSTIRGPWRTTACSRCCTAVTVTATGFTAPRFPGPVPGRDANLPAAALMLIWPLTAMTATRISIRAWRKFAVTGLIMTVTALLMMTAPVQPAGMPILTATTTAIRLLRKRPAANQPDGWQTIPTAMITMPPCSRTTRRSATARTITVTPLLMRELTGMVTGSVM